MSNTQSSIGLVKRFIVNTAKFTLAIVALAGRPLYITFRGGN